MPDNELAAGIVSLRPFVPAKDFQTSTQFYIDPRLDLGSRYEVRAPVPPRLEPWGLRVAYIFDPSGVLWHLAEEAK
jgi:hypothetical protein